MMNVLISNGMELRFWRCPEGYEYYIDTFNKTTKRIWIINNRFNFVHMNGEGQPKSVWGFYRPKTGKFYSPINHKKVGKEVKLEETTPYSGMLLNLNPLEQVLYG